MTKPKTISPNEEFIAQGYVWSYSISDNKVKFSVLRKHDGKAVKKEKPSPTIPSESEIRKYASDNGYNPDFMWERAKGYIDAGMKDSQGNDVKNLKLKLNQVWFKPANKIKQELTQDFFQENV